MPESTGVAVISAPKSASTFMYHALSRICGPFQGVGALQAANGRAVLPEVDLAVAAAVRASSARAIMHQHLLANANTLAFIERSGLRPLVLWRDLDDAMVSLTEEWERQWTAFRHQIELDGSHLQFLGAVPLSFIDNYTRADRTQRYDMTIDLALPWYCQFIAGWREVQKRMPALATFVTFEELADDETGALTRAIRQMRLEPKVDIASAVADLKGADRKVAHITVGRRGRGKELLTSAQRERIARVWAFFEPAT